MKLLRIAKEDSVAVCTEAVRAGELLSSGEATLAAKEDIPAGHKIALRDHKAGENVIKYAFPIGHAKEAIPEGTHVHTHNLASNLEGQGDFSYEPELSLPVPRAPETILAYPRKNGSIGIRNEIWILPTVGCSAPCARQIEQRCQELVTGNVEGIYSYTHPHGCSQLGDDQDRTLSLLTSLALHPNAAAVLVVGLGCENAGVEQFKQMLGDYDSQRIRFLVCQEVEDEVEEGVRLIRELCTYAQGFRREPCPSSQLVVGLKCGGSDGFSGITANPLLGRFTDLLVAQGGSALLTEVPEMFGAEALLMRRCPTRELFEATKSLVNDFRGYFLRYGEKINENPSPGNKAGGISTLEEKSLGCVQKGGKAPVTDVIPYGKRIRTQGLTLLQAPGNDLVSSTALAAAGAHMVLFSSGRGTPFACPVPTVKIASNSALFEKKGHWMDFDAGRLLQGEEAEQLTEEFAALLFAIASGEKKARSEAFDKHELAVFKDGVTL